MRETNIKVVKIDVQTGVGLNMFLPEFHTLEFYVYEPSNKVTPVNASFTTPYKSVSKSAKSKKSKI